jgi:hypothetical protein
MWPLVIEAAGALGAVAATWRFDLPGATELGTPLTFSHEPADDAQEGAAALFRFRFSVPGGRTDERSLELGWTDGRKELDRDTEIAAEIFCDHLGEALDSVRSPSLVRVALPPS